MPVSCPSYRFFEKNFLYPLKKAENWGGFVNFTFLNLVKAGSCKLIFNRLAALFPVPVGHIQGPANHLGFGLDDSLALDIFEGRPDFRLHFGLANWKRCG